MFLNIIRKIINKLNIDNHIMNFSAILDISSFFIGMIINLLLIALICYYFKRKYENLEIAQNEQAKVLYQLLQQNSSPKVMNISDVLKDRDTCTYKDIVSDTESESDSDSETDARLEPHSDSDSDSDESCEVIEKFDNKPIAEIKTISLDKNDDDEIKIEKIQPVEIIDEKVKKETKKEEDMRTSLTSINVDIDDLEDINEKDYSKMSIKQLKEILSVKGINPTKMKKNEMIELIEKSSVSIDENES